MLRTRRSVTQGPLRTPALNSRKHRDAGIRIQPANHRDRRFQELILRWFPLAGRDVALWQTFPTRLFFAATPSSYVATSIPHFVSLEVRTINTLRGLGLLATLGRWTVIAVLWM